MRQLYLIYLGLLGLLTSPLVAQNKLIVENRVWEYCYPNFENSWYEQYMFDGTREANGKTYHQWKLVKRTDFSSYGDSEPVETPKDSVVALMREEAGKVYLLLDGQDIRTYNADTKTLSKPFVAPEGTESLLYDFNLSVNDKVDDTVKLQWFKELDFEKRPTIITPCEVVSVTPFELNNEVTKKFTLEAEFQKEYLKHMLYDLDDSDGEIILTGEGEEKYDSQEQFRIYYAEVIGNCGSGNMISITTSEPIYLTSGFRDYKLCYLSSVFDTDGTYIYGKPSGVKATELSVPEKDSRIYDLHGRVVANPQSGSIYIQNGKKFVAK